MKKVIQEGFDIENLCEKLLANTVIEEYKVERIENLNTGTHMCPYITYNV